MAIRPSPIARRIPSFRPIANRGGDRAFTIGTARGNAFGSSGVGQQPFTNAQNVQLARLRSALTSRPAAPRRLGPDTVGQTSPVPAPDQIDTTPRGFSGGTGSYDINADPSVALARNLSDRIRATARASALAKTKQAAIEFGDASGVPGLDQATIAAARGNPFSVLANQQHSFDVGTQNLEDQLNKANLFYSGFRGQQLGEANRSFQANRADASNRFRALLSDIQDQLTQSLLSADQQDALAALNSQGGFFDSGGGFGPDNGGSGGTSGIQPSNVFPNDRRGIRLGAPSQRVRPVVRALAPKPIASRRFG